MGAIVWRLGGLVLRAYRYRVQGLGCGGDRRLRRRERLSMQSEDGLELPRQPLSLLRLGLLVRLALCGHQRTVNLVLLPG